MKKKILALILCALMILPCFTWIAGAVDAEGPNGEQIINIAPNGRTYQTSNWNQDSSARFLNNGVLNHSWQFWRPSSSQRTNGVGVDDTLQWAGVKFNNYYSVNEVTIYGAKYSSSNGAYCGKCDAYINDSDFTTTYKTVSGQQVVDQRLCNTCGINVTDLSDERNNIKYTVKVLIQGEWVEAGYAYNNDMEYYVNEKDYQVVKVAGQNIGILTIKFDNVFPQYDENGDILIDSNGDPLYTDYATTKNIRIECSEYGAYVSRGATSEMSFVYSGDEVTHVNYKGKQYAVTKVEDAVIPTYTGTYSNGYPMTVTVNESVGAVGYSIIQVDYLQEKLDSDNNVVYDDDGNAVTENVLADRYLFEYDDAKIKITNKLSSSHDWWLVPILHEVQAWGFKTVNTPRFDVPEGAEVVSDAALGGMAGATTSALNQYPLLGNDRTNTTQWMANDYENQEYWVDFDMDYNIKEIKINFGSAPAIYSGSEYVYDVYVKKNGEWVVLIEDQTATTSSELWTDLQLAKFEVNDAIGGVKVSFKSSVKDGEAIEPMITEISAPIADGKQCVFLSGYLDYFRASSSAQGNLACYGTAYCSSSFDYANVSDVNYIIDGQVTDDAFSWYGANFAKGTYCGVVLKDTETVTKVVLYFNDEITLGNPENHVMTFEVQALVGGQYVKVAEGTSYDDATKSPIVSIELDEAVSTNDIRIVYTSSAMVFPYLKELEVYAGQKVYGAYDGYSLDASIRTLHGRNPSLLLAERSVVSRAKYLDAISPKVYIVPVEQMILAMQYGIDVNALI